MSAQDIKDTFTRAGVQLALTVNGQDDELFGEVLTPLTPGGDSIRFGLWGSGVVTIKVADIRMAVTPNLRHAEFRAIRAKQREQFGGAAGGMGIVIHDPTIPDRCCDE